MRYTNEFIQVYYDNLLKFHRDGDRSLQLLIFNDEFLINTNHQFALTMSSPFVHTSLSYRLNGLMKFSDHDDAYDSP